MTSIATTVIVIGVLFGDRRLARLADRLGARDAAAYLAPVAARLTSPTSTPGWRSSSASTSSPAPTQNLRSFLTTLVVAGLAAFGIHELRKQTERGVPRRRLRRHLRPHQGPRRRRRQEQRANIGERASKLRLPEMRSRRRERRRARRRPRRAADDEDARLERLERLGDLHEKGILTDEEFAAEKARLLNADD